MAHTELFRDARRVHARVVGLVGPLGLNTPRVGRELLFRRELVPFRLHPPVAVVFLPRALHDRRHPFHLLADVLMVRGHARSRAAVLSDLLAEVVQADVASIGVVTALDARIALHLRGRKHVLHREVISEGVVLGLRVVTRAPASQLRVLPAIETNCREKVLYALVVEVQPGLHTHQGLLHHRTHGGLLGHDVFEQRALLIGGLHAIPQALPVEGGVPVLFEVVAQLTQQLLPLLREPTLGDLAEFIHHHAGHGRVAEDLLRRVEAAVVLLHGNVVQRVDRLCTKKLGLRRGLGPSLPQTGNHTAPVEYIRATRQGVELLRSPFNTGANPLGHSGDIAHRFEAVIQHVNALLGFEDVCRVVPLWAVDAGHVIGVAEPLAELPRFRQREAFVKLLLDVLLCNAQLRVHLGCFDLLWGG